MSEDKFLARIKRIEKLDENLITEINSLGSDIPPFYKDPKNLREKAKIYVKLGDPGYRKLEKYFDFKKDFLAINPRAQCDYLNILSLYELKYPRIDSDYEDNEED